MQNGIMRASRVANMQQISMDLRGWEGIIQTILGINYPQKLSMGGVGHDTPVTRRESILEIEKRDASG